MNNINNNQQAHLPIANNNQAVANPPPQNPNNVQGPQQGMVQRGAQPNQNRHQNILLQRFANLALPALFHDQERL